MIGSAIDQVRVDPELRKSSPLSELLAPLLWGVPRSREWTLWEFWLRRARGDFSRKMVPIFQVGFGYARSLVSLGLEGCAGRIEAVVHADVKSSVSWQAHILECFLVVLPSI